MSKYGKRSWEEVEAHQLPELILSVLEDVGDTEYFAIRRYIVEQAWEIEHLRKALEDIGKAASDKAELHPTLLWIADRVSDVMEVGDVAE